MPTSKFPVLLDNQTMFPAERESALCPVCGKVPVSSSEEHVVMYGGALLLSKKGKVQQLDDLQAFLFIDWESGHRLDAEGRVLETPHAEFELARDVKKGQFSMFFCSTVCLRAFLNECVDELETKIANQKKKA